MTHSQHSTASSRRRSPIPLGHLSCVLDTPVVHLKASSNPVSAHVPELRAGTKVLAVVQRLRLRRATPTAVWPCAQPQPPPAPMRPSALTH